MLTIEPPDDLAAILNGDSKGRGRDDFAVDDPGHGSAHEVEGRLPNFNDRIRFEEIRDFRPTFGILSDRGARDSSVEPESADRIVAEEQEAFFRVARAAGPHHDPFDLAGAPDGVPWRKGKPHGAFDAGGSSGLCRIAKHGPRGFLVHPLIIQWDRREQRYAGLPNAQARPVCDVES